MGWLNYYNLLEKYGGDLSKATRQEMLFAARCNPNDPVTARRIAEARWKDEQEEKMVAANSGALTSLDAMRTAARDNGFPA